MAEQGELQQLAEALDRFTRKTDELISAGNKNTARIEVNAGGAGVWVATTCAMVMIAVLAAMIPIGVAAYRSTQAQLDRLGQKDEIHDAWIQTLNNNKQDKAK